MPLFFGGGFFDLSKLSTAAWAFLAFCLTASAIYCLNDIIDVKNDRLHADKSKRPIAAGKVTVKQAYVVMGVLLLLTALIFIFTPLSGNYTVIGLTVFYFLMNIAYCLHLKHYSIIDVMIISLGFVLRVVIGGFATGTELSHWIVQMTFLLALFLAFAKRRDDVVLFTQTGIKPRNNTHRYTLEFINQATASIASITMVCYIMYSTSDEVVKRFHNDYIYITSLFVLSGLLRYQLLTIVDARSGSPIKLLLKDKFLQVCLLGWAITFFVIIYKR